MKNLEIRLFTNLIVLHISDGVTVTSVDIIKVAEYPSHMLVTDVTRTLLNLECKMLYFSWKVCKRVTWY